MGVESVAFLSYTGWVQLEKGEGDGKVKFERIWHTPRRGVTPQAARAAGNMTRKDMASLRSVIESMKTMSSAGDVAVAATRDSQDCRRATVDRIKCLPVQHEPGRGQILLSFID